MWQNVKEIVGKINKAIGDLLGNDIFAVLLTGFLILCILWILVKLLAFIVGTLFISSFMLIMCFVALLFVGGLFLIVSGVWVGLWKLWDYDASLAMGVCIVFGLLLCVASGFTGYRLLKEVKEIPNNE